MTLFNLNYLLKNSAPNILTVGVGTLKYGFGEDTTQPMVITIYGLSPRLC